MAESTDAASAVNASAVDAVDAARDEYGPAFRKLDRQAQRRRDRALVIALWAHHDENITAAAAVTEAQIIESYLKGEPT